MARIITMLSDGSAKLSAGMPYPKEFNRANGILDEDRVTKETATIFLKLAKAGKMPGRVISAASGLIDEMLTIVGVDAGV